MTETVMRAKTAAKRNGLSIFKVTIIPRVIIGASAEPFQFLDIVEGAN